MQRVKKIKQFLFSGWFWKGILFPFLVTRFLWLLTALFSANYLPNPTYQNYSSRGWMLSPHFLIDIWSRWDAKWYLSIVENGYQPSADLTTTISNVAFFPLYSWLIKLLNALVPASLQTRSLTLLIGIALSNLFFLVGAALLYLLVKSLYDEKAASRTLGLYFVFPSSFFFSAFYTESIFLLLSVAVFLAAHKKRWILSAVLAALLALTRPQGFLIVLSLLILYMQARNWKLRQIRADVLAFALPLIALAFHISTIFRLTGDPLAMVTVQQAWGRVGGGFFERIWLEIGAPVLDIFKLDGFFLLLFLVTSLVLLFKPKTLAYGVFALLLVIMPLASGSVISGTRYVLPAFPVFVFWAQKLKHENVYVFSRAFLFMFQVILFLGWTNYYWVG